MGKGKEKPKLVNCCSDYVIKAINKIGKFDIIHKSTSHIKIIHRDTGKTSGITQRTKSKSIKQGLMKAFVENYLIRDLGYKEEEIYKYLWC